MLDGVVAQGRQGLVFRRAEVDEACVERVQAAVRHQVLGLFEWRGLLSSETLGVMQGWGHRGGFSVHAASGWQRRMAPTASGCCDIVRVRCVLRSGWCGREKVCRCATG